MPIYQPAEDSFLLSKVVEKFVREKKPEKILEIGSGSGIQAQTCILAGAKQKDLTLVDLDLASIKHLKKKFPSSKIILSDLFENVDGKFDLIIFNPPYLPEDSREPECSRLATTGGKTGSEVINRFLANAKNHLEKNGKILLLTGNLTKKIKFSNYRKKLLDKEKLFFEELYVWELSRKNKSKTLNSSFFTYFCRPGQRISPPLFANGL